VKLIITFENVSGSLRTEQALKHSPYPCVLDAAPRCLGASCTDSIRTEARTTEEIAALLENEGIVWTKRIRDDA
jgi:hypothetical protein